MKKIKKQGFLKLASLFLFDVLSATALLAQAPATLAESEKSAAPSPKSSAYANADLTFKIIDAANNTFGYDVYAEGRLMVHQASVPALPGNGGFKVKADAEKVARLVIDKIRKGEMPPTVTLDEMKRLNALREPNAEKQL